MLGYFFFINNNYFLILRIINHTFLLNKSNQFSNYLCQNIKKTLHLQWSIWVFYLKKSAVVLYFGVGASGLKSWPDHILFLCVLEQDT
jgi:hypothetical protein